MRRLLEQDYFSEDVEMHYALLQAAENIGPEIHTHDFFEIFLISQGQIKHIINGRHLNLRDGAMTLVRPDDIHYYQPLPGCKCEVINLAVARRVINDLFAYLGDGFRASCILEPSLPPTVHLSTAVKRQVRAKLEALNRIPATSAAKKRTALRMLLFELITHYFPLVTQPAAAEMPAWLRHACQAMQQPENLSGGVARMAELAAVSPEHLARTMRKLLQQTPTDYINHLRLTYAANLLTHGDRAIVDVAAEAGFDSLSYFYTLFKVHYGQTPRQFRRARQPQLLHGRF